MDIKNTNNTFHESRDSSMDKALPKRSIWYKYRYYILSLAAFLIFLVYILIAVSGGRKLRVNSNNIIVANVTETPFLDYVDAEGIIQPILTIKLNSLESGMVQQIVAEEGTMLKQGDTIMILHNPELEITIEEQQSEWETQRILYQEKRLEMEQKSLFLKQQTLQVEFELSRLEKDYKLGVEEFNMGVKSKAQLDVQHEEYIYKTKDRNLQLEGLRHDSAATILRRELMNNELERARINNTHVSKRIDNLIVKAPISGQLSFLNATLGQQIHQSENIGEIKVMDNFKIATQLSEYYIDRVMTGLPASVIYQGNKYPLKVSKVVPEVRDRQFRVELIFTDDKPDNVRIGKSFRLQIELDQPDTAIVIPRGDFFQVTGGQWIYKLNDSENKAIRTPITVGRQNPIQYEIIGGLKPGEKVITTGYTNFGEADELIIK